MGQVILAEVFDGLSLYTRNRDWILAENKHDKASRVVYLDDFNIDDSVDRLTNVDFFGAAVQVKSYLVSRHSVNAKIIVVGGDNTWIQIAE